jgi:hypothetical protein
MVLGLKLSDTKRREKKRREEKKIHKKESENGKRNRRTSRCTLYQVG